MEPWTGLAVCPNAEPPNALPVEPPKIFPPEPPVLEELPNVEDPPKIEPPVVGVCVVAPPKILDDVLPPKMEAEVAGGDVKDDPPKIDVPEVWPVLCPKMEPVV